MTGSLTAERSAPARLPAIGTTPAWLTLSDELLAGFCHELGGRASAFVSIAHLATRQSVRTGFVLGEIERESEQLARLANLLRVLPRSGGEAPRAVALAATVQEAVDLARYHHGLRAMEFEVDLDPNLPAVRLDRNTFIQSLLILLADSARRAVREHRTSLRVVGSLTPDGIALEIVSDPRDPSDSGISTWLDTPPPAIDASSIEAVISCWMAEGHRVEPSESGYRLVLGGNARLPGPSGRAS